MGPYPSHAGAANDEGPSDQLLPRLQALWAEVLELPTVGPDEHFMDLGGNSLLAAIVLSRLHHMAGCSLPLASLLRAPTPRRLAALALGARACVGAGAALAARPVHPLWVSLRAGQGRPLVLVHGLSGTVMECWPLVQALKGPRPLVGLQARGLDGGPLPPARVEAIAADYVEVLRREQPQGPYALCGFSFGGLVALEMARLLRARGEAVELLSLIDPYLRRGLPAWRQWWLRGRSLLARLAEMDAAGRVGWWRAQRQRLRQALAGQGSLHRQGDESLRGGRGSEASVRAHGVASMGPRQRAVRARLESCLARYLPRPYADSPVLFVQARETLPGYFNPAVVWRRVLQGPVQIEEVPGAHLQLVSAQAGVLAALIDKALEHTQTQTQTKPQSPPQAQQKVRQLRPVSPLARPR